jgi:hypothetical protein
MQWRSGFFMLFNQIEQSQGVECQEVEWYAEKEIDKL